MKKEELLKKLRLLGYPLFETKENLDANETLAEVVKSKDPRLWEGFPVLLANNLEKELFDKEAVGKYLEGTSDRTHFQRLVLMSFALYKYLRLGYPWVDKSSHLTNFHKKDLDKYLGNFKKEENFKKDLKELSSVRIVNTFKRYFRESALDLKEYTQMKSEADFEYSLSQVFSKKQKELFLKKLKGEKMTKTEREYYSRSVKKKVLALANSDLHNLAAKLAKE